MRAAGQWHGACLLLGAALCALAAPHTPSAQVSTPPRGWNSWDSFKGNLNEAALDGVAQKMVDLILPSNYSVLTIDEFWYPNDAGSAADVDEYGRAVIDTSKWPSAAGGAGFLPVSQKLAKLGLTLGIHVMHGVPTGALQKDTKVMGTDIPVSSLAMPDVCPWNKNWHRVNTSAPGAQAYYDSIYKQYAEWGVKFIKLDCVFGENFQEDTKDDIRATHDAIVKAGGMVFSLSPGFRAFNSSSTVAAVANVSPLTNLYRVTSDWHGWQGADGVQGWPNHFDMAAGLKAFQGAPGLNGASFPDLDMLHPFPDTESFRMQQTLWTLSHSPLIYGGDLRNLTADHPHVQLMTNRAVLETTTQASGAHQVFRTPEAAVFASSTSGGPVFDVVALFRLAGSGTVEVAYDKLGWTHDPTSAIDLWTGKPLPLGGSAGLLTLSLSECKKSGSPKPCAALVRLA